MAMYAIVGTKYRPLADREHFASLPAGAPLTLKRDINNPRDPNAVQVWSGDRFVGYVKGDQVGPLAMAMDAMPAARAGAPAENIYRHKSGVLRNDPGKWPLVEVAE